MTRRCSHCSNNGHNSRTCPTRGGGGGSSSSANVSGGGSGGAGGVRLFGVRLTDGSIMKKSASMGNLSHHNNHSSSSPNPSSPSSDPFQDPVQGYLSDDPNHASCSANRRAERKKGVPWTEEEHRLFLIGLQKLGKGDWRGISRNYVPSRTPTQVASHAQKYFIRQTNASRRKRRSSLFDMVPEMATDTLPLAEEQFMLPPQVVDSSKEKVKSPHEQPLEDGAEKTMPSLDLSLKPDFEPMEATPSKVVEETVEAVTPMLELPPMIPAFYPALVPITFGIWPPNVIPLQLERGAEVSHHQVHKPIPVLPKQPVNVDALVGMSQLSLVENGSIPTESTRLSLNLTPETTRQSAFHASTPLNGSGINKDKNDSFQGP